MLSTLACVALAISFAVSSMAIADVPLDPSLNERVLSVPGDPARPVMLQVTTFTPDGPGPFPLAILNHGKETGKPSEEPRYRSAYIARYFLSRGYAVALPMMRGFAGSGGVFDPHGCDVATDGLDQAHDIAAVIDYMTRQPNIDATRIIVSGQSFGGWNTLAFATLGYPNVKGVLNFAGGIRAPTCPDWETDLISVAGAYGARTHIPSLWFYGDNDSHFPSPLFHAMYAEYQKNGGPATLIDYGPFQSDSHNMLGAMEGFPLWMPKVDQFLTSLGLPGTLVAARYLPAPFPPPSHFADIENVQAVPYLDDKGRAIYREFLGKPFPRVFILAPTMAQYFYGGYDPLTRGMEACRKITAAARIYAVDDQVVWVPPAAASTNTNAVGTPTSSNAASENELANRYRTGQGVPKDNAQAFPLYQKSADQGYAPAQVSLGFMYQSGIGVTQDYAQAITWYQKAADQGDAGAQNNLGYMYLKGLGTPKDYSRALPLFKSAADHGITSAENELGNMYANGQGVTKDYAQALTYFQDAANQGQASAQYSLGYLYQHGLGVTADASQAAIWYQRASAQGFKPATNALMQLKSVSPSSATPSP